MTIPNPNPALFVPGKVIQIRGQESPGVVRELVLISAEEHIGHVVTMLEWLWPDITEKQRAAARLHDIGKKVGARSEFVKGLNIDPDNLRADFYAQDRCNAALSPADAGQRYLTFTESGDHRRFWPTIDAQDFRMDLDPPFGNHAAEVNEEDLLLYRDGALDLQNDSQSRNYILNLIRLHHSFQPDRIVDACAQCGDELVTDLYRLIVADHAGSRWAEYVVQHLEEGLEKPEAVDFFGEVELKVVAEPVGDDPDCNLKLGRVRLLRSQLPNETGNPSEAELLVKYYPVTVNWDLRKIVESAAMSLPTRRKQRAPRRRG